MTNEALIWMLAVQCTATAAMAYFFYRVFKADENQSDVDVRE